MSYAYKNPTPEQIERRRERWRAYYYRHHEKHLQRTRDYEANLTPDQIAKRREDMRVWRANNPEKLAKYRETRKKTGYNKQWREANPDKVAAQQRRVTLKRKYGMTEADFDALYDSQGGVCAICQRPERMKISGRLMRLAVDHVRDSKIVRGLLCAACNRAIGNLDHDPEILRRAMDYLNR